VEKALVEGWGVIDSTGFLKHEGGTTAYVYVDEISLKQADT
jgi:hypothetical protein